MRTHGGHWADYLEAHGSLPLDFSCSVSPLGMPEPARAAAARALEAADRYPDPSCRALRRALAERHGLDAESILCGNGAGDLIDRLALALRPRSALVTAPTFGEYRAALERVGCAVGQQTLSTEADFGLDASILGSITRGLDLLVLCEPNNPTGRSTDPALLAAIVRRCGKTGTLLVVDECFMGFVEDGERRSLLGLVADPSTRTDILVLRALTKSHGMAGLRLGWCASTDRGLLSSMTDAGQPWPVSSVAQAAGVAALEDEAYTAHVRALVSEERPRLARGLGSLGCRVIPGEANYLLFFDDTIALAARMEAHGVLIRDCADYAGLGPGWYRVAVRTCEENDRLLATLGEVHA